MSKIKALIMDVDGTLTDGKIYMGNDGEVMKAFNIKDGYGLNNICKENDITPIIITGRKSKIVENRCKELNITHVYQGINNKLEKLKEVIKELNLSNDEVSYIGDDDNDLECMIYIINNKGIAGCPIDASLRVLDLPNIFKCKHRGGEGAVRDFIEYLVLNNTYYGKI